MRRRRTTTQEDRRTKKERPGGGGRKKQEPAGKKGAGGRPPATAPPPRGPPDRPACSPGPLLRRLRTPQTIITLYCTNRPRGVLAHAHLRPLRPQNKTGVAQYNMQVHRTV